MPEFRYTSARFFPNFRIPFSFIRSRNDNLRTHEANFIQEFMVLDCSFLARSDQLSFERSPLPVRTEMLADIKRTHIHDAFRLVQHLGSSIFFLKVSLLLFIQPRCKTVKPKVYCRLVLLELCVTTFVKQRDNSTILICLLNRIARFNHSAKLAKAILFFFHQRRSRKADIAGVREHLFHTCMQIFILRTVRLINKQKDIVGFFNILPFIQSLVELVNNSRDNGRGIRTHKIKQVFTRSRLDNFHSAMFESVMNLRIQILAVRDKDYTRIINIAIGIIC